MSLSWMLCAEMTDMEVQEYFDNFFEEVFTELEDRVITTLRGLNFILLCCHSASSHWSEGCLDLDSAVFYIVTYIRQHLS